MEKKDRETNMKLLIFWLERIQRKEPGELITFILDTSDSSLLNSDMIFTTFIIECFTTYFPYLLGELLTLMHEIGAPDVPAFSNSYIPLLLFSAASLSLYSSVYVIVFRQSRRLLVGLLKFYVHHKYAHSFSSSP